MDLIKNEKQDGEISIENKRMQKESIKKFDLEKFKDIEMKLKKYKLLCDMKNMSKHMEVHFSQNYDMNSDFNEMQHEYNCYLKLFEKLT